MVKVLILKETEDRISKDRTVSRKVRAVLLRAAVQTNKVRMASSLETDLKEMVLRVSRDRTVSSPVLQKVIAMALVSKDSLVVPTETVRARMETAISLVQSPVKVLTVRTETATRTVLHKTASLF
jgi:glycine cleavage system aminomethyltransferase T